MLGPLIPHPPRRFVCGTPTPCPAWCRGDGCSLLAWPTREAHGFGLGCGGGSAPDIYNFMHEVCMVHVWDKLALCRGGSCTRVRKVSAAGQRCSSSSLVEACSGGVEIRVQGATAHGEGGVTGCSYRTLVPAQPAQAAWLLCGLLVMRVCHVVLLVFFLASAPIVCAVANVGCEYQGAVAKDFDGASGAVRGRQFF